VEKVQEYERKILSGPEHSNKIVSLLKVLKAYVSSPGRAPQITLAVAHALRRVFTHQAETNAISQAVKDPDAEVDSVQLLRQWNRKQFLSFLDVLLKLLTVRTRNVFARVVNFPTSQNR